MVSRPLDADDLEQAVTTAYLAGRVAEAMAALQRAEQVHARQGDHRRAARSAFWLGFLLLDEAMVAAVAGELTPPVTGTSPASTSSGCSS